MHISFVLERLDGAESKQPTRPRQALDVPLSFVERRDT
jgi:hypothetical protein